MKSLRIMSVFACVVWAIVLVSTGFGQDSLPSHEFKPLLITDVGNAFENGIVGSYPSTPPSVAIGHNSWDIERDALYTVNTGPNKMAIFHARNLAELLSDGGGHC